MPLPNSKKFPVLGCIGKKLLEWIETLAVPFIDHGVGMKVKRRHRPGFDGCDSKKRPPVNREEFRALIAMAGNALIFHILAFLPLVYDNWHIGIASIHVSRQAGNILSQLGNCDVMRAG